MKIIILLIFFFTLFFSSTLIRAEISEDIHRADLFSQIIEKAKPAVVFIQVEKKAEPTLELTQDSSHDDPALKKFFGDFPKSDKNSSFFTDKTTFGSGSGFIFNSEGYILTNNHVIAGAIEITVTLADKTTHSAKIIGTDKKTDIGLIKISANNLPVIPLGDSDREKTGAWVLAIGSPYEFIQTVTAGIISATGRNGVGISDYENFIQTDAAINPGNSGGPLINIHGQVIGINTAFLTQTGGYMGIGFAIPINTARKVSEQLLKDGKVTRAWLGVALQDATAGQLAEYEIPTTTQAARIIEVKKNSPAERAGLKKGDLIMAINTTKITGAADLRNRISLFAPKSVVMIKYYRNTSKSEAKVTLGTL